MPSGSFLYIKLSISCIFYKSVTDRRTDGPTDPPSYRDARTHLKRINTVCVHITVLPTVESASVLVKLSEFVLAGDEVWQGADEGTASDQAGGGGQIQRTIPLRTHEGQRQSHEHRRQVVRRGDEA